MTGCALIIICVDMPPAKPAPKIAPNQNRRMIAPYFPVWQKRISRSQ
jgi:hypothetical protein